MAQPEKLIAVEIAYALPHEQVLLALRVPPGTCLREAIVRSGILERHPEIDAERCATGIFGRRASADTPLHDGDRVEIYRPLVADPKRSRRQRAAKRGMPGAPA